MVVRTFARGKFRNRVHTVLLFAGMVLLCSLLGLILFDTEGLIAVSAAMALILFMGPKISPNLVLSLYGARRLREFEAPALTDMVRLLASRAGLERVPALYFVPSRLVNAVSVGNPNNAAVAVTDGLLKTLSRREIFGVLAHEVAHIGNGDTRVMGLADVISQLVSLMSLFGQILLLINLPLFLFGPYHVPWLFVLLLVFCPVLTTLMQLALSRTREFDADLEAVKLTGDAGGLASALAKIERMSGGLLERIFLPGRRVPEPSLLRTHPVTEERIRRLLELEGRRIERSVDPVQAHSFSDLHHIPSLFVRRPYWHFSRLWY